MDKIINLVEQEIAAAFDKAGYDRALAKVTISNRPDLCEYQCNGAMAGAKKYKKAPFMIAEDVLTNLTDKTYIGEIEVVKPGFINIKLNEDAVAAYLNDMKKDENLGLEQAKEPKTIVIDYGGPNVAKPLHVGHLRSAVIGESVKRIARKAGHKVTKLTPALVPFEIKEDYCKQLMGLSLRNVAVTMTADGKKIYEDFGEMLFTHFGISGPVVLSASSYIGRYQGKELKFIIDLKPALNKEQLDHRVLKDFNKTLNKDFVNSLDHLLPKKLIPVMIELSGIPEHKKVNEITKKERERFVSLLKHLELTITGVRGFKEAIITQGGVNVKEIDPGTMESKKIKGLYFAGEVLDLDAVTGGFNLQIAWSTGYLAGMN